MFYKKKLLQQKIKRKLKNALNVIMKWPYKIAQRIKKRKGGIVIIVCINKVSEEVLLEACISI